MHTSQIPNLDPESLTSTLNPSLLLVREALPYVILYVVFWISSKCFTSSHNYENFANLKRTI
jgi:hypothetical protein